MPKQSIPFTETYLKSLPIPESGDDSYNDRGLRLRVYPSAAKKWSFFKQAPNGIRKSIPIGEYPNINLKQAREIADKLLGDMLREGHDIATNKKGVTFGEYMRSDAYKNWSRSTRNSHTTIMNNLTDVVPVWFHRKPLKLFTNDDFTKFCNDRKDGKDGRDGVIESTINRTLNNIRSVFRHAFDNSVIKENPMDRFSNLKEPEKPETYSFTDDERKRLISVACDRTLLQADRRRHMEAFVLLGLDTGLRNGELVSLQWKHFKHKNLPVKEAEMLGHKYLTQQEDIKSINLKKLEDFVTMAEERELEGIMTPEAIEKIALSTFEDIKGYQWHIEVEGKFTKSSKVRKVPVSNATVEIVRDYIRFREGEKYKKKYPDMTTFDSNLNILFIKSKKPTLMNALDEEPIIPVGKVDRAFKTLHRLAGLPKGTFIHTMRHDFCTEMIKKGVNLSTVQKLAGHSSIVTTQKYLHALRGTDWSELDELNLSERISN